MSYDPNDATLLKHLVDLATRVSSQGYQNAGQVQALIDAAITTVYKPGGTKTATELTDTTTPLLVAANEGKVYDISTVLTITDQTKSMFVEGLSGTYPIGTNFVVINVGTDSVPSYKFDALPGFIDLSGYASKVSPATVNNLVKQDANGDMDDAGIAAGDVVTKIVSPTAGNLVSQDSNGKIADSGIAAANVMQKVASANANDFALLNASGEVVDAGFGVATDAEVDEALDTIFPTT